MRVLLIESYAPVVRALRLGLEEEGFVLDVARDRAEGNRKAWTLSYDVVILDMMIREGGMDLLRKWRQAGLTTHVLALTAPGNVQEKIKTLDGGADDCLPKPFAFEELVARVRALGRRAGPAPDPVLRSGDLEIDPDRRTVTRAGRPIPLTPREYALLEFLARHRGRVVSRSLIWEQLYDDKTESTSNVVDVYIRYLRKKIDQGFGRPLILTRWGEGYLLRDEPI